MRMHTLVLAPGLHLYVSAECAWVGAQLLDGWLALQPLPCLGLAVRLRR